MRKIFFIAISIFFSLSIIAQDKGRYVIRGTIKDSLTGETLPNASVHIDGTSYGTTSNADGNFQLFADQDGEVRLVVSYIGYSENVVVAKVRASNAIIIYLTAISQDLQEVLVNAENKSTTVQIPTDKVGVVHMNPRLMTKLPNMGEVDIFRSLQLLPGINGTQETSSGLIIRGGTSDQNLILFDGMPIYHVDHFYGIFSAFNVNAIKDIQVYKGGFEPKYGGRASGVIDIFCRDASMKKIKGNVGLNMLSSNASLEIPLIKEKMSLMVAARRSYTDVLKTDLYKKLYENITTSNPSETMDGLEALSNGTGQGAQFPNFYFYDFNSKLTYKPDSKNTFSLSAYLGKDFLDKSNLLGGTSFIPMVDISGSNPTTKNQLIDKTQWGNKSILTRWSRQWETNFYSKLNVSFSDYFSNYDYLNKTTVYAKDETSFENSTKQKNTVKDLSVKLDNEWSVSRGNQIQFGANYQFNDISYLFAFDDTLKLQDRRDRSTTLSCYLQDKFSPLSKLTFVGGLRATGYSVKNSSFPFFLEPRLSAVYNISDKLRLKAATGKYYQFMNRVILEDILSGARDFWIPSNNRDIPVLLAKHFILGGSYESKSLLFDLELYHKDIDGLMEYSNRYGIPDFKTMNKNDINVNFYTGKGAVNGLDLLLQKKVGKLTGWIGYTLQNVKYKFDAFDAGRQFPASHDQTHEIKFVAMYSSRGWDLSATFIYATGKPYTMPIGKYTIEMLDGKKQSFIQVSDKNSQRLPAYHRFDISASKNFKINRSDGQVGLSIYNIYGHKNIKYRQFQKVDYKFDGNKLVQLAMPRFNTIDVVSLGFTPNIFVNFNF